MSESVTQSVDAPSEAQKEVFDAIDGNKETKPEAPIVPKETKKEEPPASNKKKYKLKVDQNEEEFELDLSNDEEIKKHLQKSKASDKRFEEAAEVRKAAMQFIEELRKNPRKVLSDPNIGVDLKKFAEEVLNEEIAEMEKSPEQREREKLQKELEDLKKQAKDREEKNKQDEFQRMQVEQEKKLEVDISAALDVGGIPKTPRTVKAMAEMMMIALENNIDLTAKDIAPLVKNTTLSEFKEVVQSLTDDQLEDFLGKEVLGRLRKKNVAKAKAVETASSVKSTGTSSKKVEDSSVKKMFIKDFLKA